MTIILKTIHGIFVATCSHLQGQLYNLNMHSNLVRVLCVMLVGRTELLFIMTIVRNSTDEHNDKSKLN